MIAQALTVSGFNWIGDVSLLDCYKLAQHWQIQWIAIERDGKMWYITGQRPWWRPAREMSDWRKEHYMRTYSGVKHHG